MKKHNKRWGILYGVFLAIYSLYALLDAFVIPSERVSVVEAEAYMQKANSGGTAGKNIGKHCGKSHSSGEFPFNGSRKGHRPHRSGNNSSSSGIAADAAASPSVTDAKSYTDEGVSITLEEKVINDTTVYIADITLSDLSLLRSGLAQDSFGRNISEKTSAIAAAKDAVLAINGDYYGFRSSGYVMRNGYLYRSEKSADDAEDLVVYEDGTFAIIREGDVTAEELKDAGAYQIYSFGPGLIENGQITVGTSEEVGRSMNSNPRTAIGQMGEGHYVMVVSDGRTAESAGLTLYQLAEVMQSLGCETAYNLDGGGSTTMYFNGEVVNKPTTNGHSIKERTVSDIVYIGKS